MTIEMEHTRTKTVRVLIVDDERLFAELLRVALRSADGIDVVDVVHDVQTAVRRMTDTRPDVVLADYHLPDGTGSDIARTVRAALPDTSVLILTGDPSVSTLSDVARSGAVGHLTKDRPFEQVVEGVRAAALGETRRGRPGRGSPSSPCSWRRHSNSTYRGGSGSVPAVTSPSGSVTPGATTPLNNSSTRTPSRSSRSCCRCRPATPRR